MSEMNYPSIGEFSGFAIFSIFCCGVFGMTMSNPATWEKYFPPGSTQIYVKAGEYGETEVKSTWSVFKEPLNAWTSLFYAVFGTICLSVGVRDYFDVGSEEKNNRLTTYPVFSVLYGAFSIYLGVASFLFHASHSEVWRKADAGMTSGTVLPLLCFQLFDRVRAPAVSSMHMAGISLVLLLSFTYGYLPYGSSDILLPALVLIMFGLELHPRYGGVIHSDEYILWLEATTSVVLGVLLRAADIKRKSPSSARNLLLLSAAWLCGMAIVLGPLNFIIIGGFGAVAIVHHSLDKGHIFWHLCSSLSLFLWWFLLKYRPGDPLSPSHVDTALYSFVLFIAVKNALRRIFMSVPFPSQSHRTSVFSLLEHTFLAYCAIQAILFAIDRQDSWYFHVGNNFLPPSLPTDQFHLYFIIKTSCLIEDFLYSLVEKSTDPEKQLPIAKTYQSDGAKPFVLDIPKLMRMILALFSYAFGYARIASVVMMMHDLGGQPQAFVLVMKLYDTVGGVITAISVFAVAAWSYCRVWIPLMILWAVVGASPTELESASQFCANSYCESYIPMIRLILGTSVLTSVAIDGATLYTMVHQLCYGATRR